MWRLGSNPYNNGKVSKTTSSSWIHQVQDNELHTKPNPKLIKFLPPNVLLARNTPWRWRWWKGFGLMVDVFHFFFKFSSSTKFPLLSFSSPCFSFFLLFPFLSFIIFFLISLFLFLLILILYFPSFFLHHTNM